MSALVLFSGGQDSATCLAWALSRFDRVETLAFSYGQRHAVELDCRPPVLSALRTLDPAWEGRLGSDHHIDLSFLAALSDSALTTNAEITFAADGLPTSFVPGRNLLFLTAAAALACRRGIAHIVLGVCETDYSGYPDCRDDTIKAMQVALNLGMQQHFVLHTPLMWKDKSHTWQLAERLGGAPLVELIRTRTHSCYLGDREQDHEWGRGCGTCPACELRARGWEQYRRATPA